MQSSVSDTLPVSATVQRCDDVLRRVDVIVAGVPCQDVSVAGKRAGLAGERTRLFYDFARLLLDLRPDWFVFENVPGLLSSNRGRDFAEVLRVLMVQCGYGVQWRVLNSQFFGVAQRRRRLFVVGRFGRPCPAEILFEPESRSGNPSTCEASRPDLAATLTSGIGVTGNAPRRRREDDFNLVASSGERARALTGSMWKRHDEDTDTLVATLNSGGNGGGFRTEPGEHLIAYALRRDPGGIGQGHNTNYAIAAPLKASDAKNFAGSGRGNDGVGTAVISETADAERMRTASGISTGLDDTEGVLLNALSKETNSGEILRAVQCEVGAEAFAEWGLGILDSFPKAAILRSEVLRIGEPWAAEAVRQLQYGPLSCSAHRSNGAMQEMFEAGRLGCTPHRWRLAEQLTVELRAYLSILPYLGARDATTGRCDQCGESHEGRCWPLLSKGLDSARYRALGNAVTVQVVEWIANRIAAAAKQAVLDAYMEKENES